MDDVLAILTQRTGGAVDAFWHLIYPLDGQEILTIREKQKMQLARYGKQSLLQWDDVEISEIRKWHERLAELVKSENPTTSGSED